MFKVVGQNIRSLLKFFEIFISLKLPNTNVTNKNCTFSRQILGQLLRFKNYFVIMNYYIF